jgi:hypothetical protein
VRRSVGLGVDLSLFGFLLLAAQTARPPGSFGAPQVVVRK